MDEYEIIKQLAVPVMAKSKMISMAMEQDNIEKAMELCSEVIPLASEVIMEHRNMLAAYIVATSGYSQAYECYDHFGTDPLFLANFACAKMKAVYDFLSQHIDDEKCATLLVQYSLHIFAPMAQITRALNQNRITPKHKLLVYNEVFLGITYLTSACIEALTRINPSNQMAAVGTTMVENFYAEINPKDQLKGHVVEVENMDIAQLLVFVSDFVSSLVEEDVDIFG